MKQKGVKRKGIRQAFEKTPRPSKIDQVTVSNHYDRFVVTVTFEIQKDTVWSHLNAFSESVTQDPQAFCESIASSRDKSALDGFLAGFDWATKVSSKKGKKKR